MFPLNRTPGPQTSPVPESDDSGARIVIAADGAILYASPAFAKLAKRTDFSDVNAAAILRFPKTGGTFKSIAAGPHTIAFEGVKGNFSFQFDWLTAPDQKRYLVGTQITETPADGDAKKIFESVIRRALQTKLAETIESPQDLQRFLDMTQDVLLVADESGAIVRVNKAFLDIFGADENDRPMDLADLFHPGDRARVRNALAANENAAQNFDARILTASGEERWMEWRQRKEDGLIYCAGRDVTSLKRQRKALNRREEQLKEAESIGRMGHWRWTIGSAPLEWSDEIYRIFGVERESFKPTLESMNALIHKRDLPRVNQAFQRAMIEHKDYDVEFRVNRPAAGGGSEKTDETRYIHCEGRSAINSEGEVTALYGIMQDITERMLHERDLKAAKDAAERAYAAKSQFLANMSHELRTPLNAIIGFSEMIQRQILGPIGTPKYLEYVKGIHESGEHLLDIISDILDMSKIEAGKYELMLEEVNVHKIVKLAAHMIEGRAMDNNIKISIDEPENPGRLIVADRRAILQILLNLLSNAVKFSHKGGAVRVECLERTDGVSIRVIDSGVGIPANKLASITRPFEQAAPHYTREHEGTGLGLAITKELVEMHGGTLQIESTVDVGTTATVKLPFDADKATRK